MAGTAVGCLCFVLRLIHVDNDDISIGLSVLNATPLLLFIHPHGQLVRGHRELRVDHLDVPHKNRRMGVGVEIHLFFRSDFGGTL